MGRYYCRMSVNGNKIRSCGDGSRGSLKNRMLLEIVRIEFGDKYCPVLAHVKLSSTDMVTFEFFKKAKCSRRKYAHCIIFSRNNDGCGDIIDRSDEPTTNTWFAGVFKREGKLYLYKKIDKNYITISYTEKIEKREELHYIKVIENADTIAIIFSGDYMKYLNFEESSTDKK